MYKNKFNLIRNGKMDHISANLAFGRREKNIFGGTKSSKKGQEAYKKNRKKGSDLFLFVWRQ